MKVTLCYCIPVAMAALLSGCATTPNVQTQAKPGVDYSKYHTFALMPLPAPQTASDPGMMLRLAEPARQAVVTALVSKGLSEVDRGQADLAINLRGQSLPKVEVTDWGYTRTAHTRWGPYPVRVGEVNVRTYEEKTMTIEIYDNRTKDLAWLGWATTTSGKEITAEKLQEVIRRILSDFPAHSTSQTAPN
jgi:hypothetical protein